MDLNEYQKEALKTANFPGGTNLVGLLYAGIGLNGEAGEYGEKVKKMLREEHEFVALALSETLRQLADSSDIVKAALGDVLPMALEQFEERLLKEMSQNPELRERQEKRKKEAIKELGDNLWYNAVSASLWGVTLEVVAQNNVDKLRSRQERNVLHGSGDNR